jgi:class 3 adenylate cyclase
LSENDKKDKKPKPTEPKIPDRLSEEILGDLFETRILGRSGPIFATGIGSSILPTYLADIIATGLEEDVRKQQSALDSEIAKLKQQIEDSTKALREEKTTAEVLAKKKSELEEKVKDLTQKERLGFLLDRVNPEGQQALLRSQDFQKKFLDQQESSALVLSIDIRRSTELMLKARTAQAFAHFIINLCFELLEIIKRTYGVVDKFTGDGVLAFYPEFYSGRDAAYYAISAAEQCHAAFRRHYDKNRQSFKSILTDVGLGIGIDYGAVHLVQIAGGLTVVGEPVVYACRLSGAPAGETLLNQPAYEQVANRFSAFCFVNESELEIKHEGRMLAYSVTLNGGMYSSTVPDWVQKLAVVQD